MGGYDGSFGPAPCPHPELGRRVTVDVDYDARRQVTEELCGRCGAVLARAVDLVDPIPSPPVPEPPAGDGGAYRPQHFLSSAAPLVPTDFGEWAERLRAGMSEGEARSPRRPAPRRLPEVRVPRPRARAAGEDEV